MDNKIDILSTEGHIYKKGEAIAFHVHDYFQIFFIIYGASAYRYAEEQISLVQDEFLLVLPNVKHGMLPVQVAQVNVLDIKFFIKDVKLAERIKEKNQKYRIELQSEKNLFLLMYDIARERKINYCDILSNTLATIIYIKMSNSNKSKANKKNDFFSYNHLGECAKKTLCFLECCVFARTNNRIEEMPRRLGYNKAYMYRCFREDVGISIKQYLTLLKIDKAKELLLNTDNEISLICRLIGFENIPYFTKIFKNHTGMTPSEYRKHGSTDDSFLNYSFRLNDGEDFLHDNLLGKAEPPPQNRVM